MKVHFILLSDKFSTKVTVQKSTCCKGRIRIGIGRRGFCLSKLEAFNLSSDIYKKLKTMVYGRQK